MSATVSPEIKVNFGPSYFHVINTAANRFTMPPQTVVNSLPDLGVAVVDIFNDSCEISCKPQTVKSEGRVRPLSLSEEEMRHYIYYEGDHINFAIASELMFDSIPAKISNGLRARSDQLGVSPAGLVGIGYFTLNLFSQAKQRSRDVYQKHKRSYEAKLFLDLSETGGLCIKREEHRLLNRFLIRISTEK